MTNKIGIAIDWIVAAAATVHRVVHRLRRDGIPSLIGGTLFVVTGIASKNYDMAGGGAGLLAYGISRALYTRHALQRRAHMHAHLGHG